MRSRRSRKENRITRTSSNQLRSSKPRSGFRVQGWHIGITLIVLAFAFAVFSSVSATAVHPFVSAPAPSLFKNDALAARARENVPASNAMLASGVLPSGLVTPTLPMGNGSVSGTSPYPYFEPDTQVLVYTGHGQTGWEPIPFRLVPWGVEFLFDDRFYDIDSAGRVRVNLSVKATATALAEADRAFEPYKSRWPEQEDLVRFVDSNNRHLLHNRAGTFQPGDRFWFQGVLYEGAADPAGPSGRILKNTNYVLGDNGRVMLVDEFALARGDSLDKVRGTQANTSVSATPATDIASNKDVLLTSLNSGASSTGLGLSEQQNSGIQSNRSTSGGSGGIPTDFLFAGQRWESSIGLYQMGDRWYDPALGRFISPDPIVPNSQDPQSWNRYSYVLNNPVKYTDPTGHMACLEDNFCFRRANGNDLVVRGGSYFVNPVEIGLANYYLSGGDTVHLNAVPAYNPLPLAYSKAGVEVALGYRENRPGIPDIASGVGAAVIVGKDDDILPAESVPGGERLGYTQTARDAATGAVAIDPYKVRFSQSSINYSFRDGGNIDDLAEGLRSGRIRPEDVPPIRLVERNGKLYTLDNRRLEAFRRAGVNVPYRMATSEEIAAEGWKFTTRNEGISIRVRGR